MKKHTVDPFDGKFGRKIGFGQDSIVVPLIRNNLKEDRDQSEFVVKWNHRPKTEKSLDQNFQELLYKKKKYEVLRFFLGGFIPETFFVLAEQDIREGHYRKTTIKQYSIQDRVPQMRIDELPDEVRNSPAFLKRLYLLIQKLQAMHRMIAEINEIADAQGKIDVRLDLGGLTKFIDNHITQTFGEDYDLEEIGPNFMHSPNILVDPETLGIFCIDFGSGVWNDKKDATMKLLFMLTKSRKDILEIVEQQINH